MRDPFVQPRRQLGFGATRSPIVAIAVPSVVGNSRAKDRAPRFRSAIADQIGGVVVVQGHFVQPSAAATLIAPRASYNTQNLQMRPARRDQRRVAKKCVSGRLPI